MAEAAEAPSDSPPRRRRKVAEILTAPAASSSVVNWNGVYGELIILGYNGRAVEGNRRTKFVLKRKHKATGVTKSHQYSVPDHTHSHSAGVHSVSHVISRLETVIVEYAADKSTDMFQIGRLEVPQIDFFVLHTPTGVEEIESNERVDTWISRYACRIQIDRVPPNVARLYAAGFDATKNIFIGEKGCAWKAPDLSVDGITTNGALLLHSKWNQLTDDTLEWHEVSVAGDVYTLRPNRGPAVQGQMIDGETNVLEDGALIDLCGVTLLWRTAAGLSNCTIEKQINERLNALNRAKPRCPVNLQTLMIPDGKHRNGVDEESLPYAYVNCGHVQSKHGWGFRKLHRCHECPLCRVESQDLVQVNMGMEPRFHLDSEELDHCFNPCGRIFPYARRYWSSIPLPQHDNSFKPTCPFYIRTLAAEKPYIHLIFQDHTGFSSESIAARP